MKDSELEQCIHDAFDSIEVPFDVRAATLRTIDDVRQKQDAAHSQATSSTTTKITPYETIRRRHRWFAMIASVAACLAIALAVFGIFRPGVVDEGADGSEQVYFDMDPTAFVDIDINPSIQLQLNRSDLVIGAEGLNEDGKRLLSDVCIDRMPYEQALRTLTSSDAMARYLNDDAFIELSVASEDEAQEQALTNMSEGYLESVPYRGSCNGVSLQTYEEAHSYGMGCGRYAAVVELMKLDSSLSMEECSNMSMRELRDRIAELSDPGSGQMQGGGSGSGSGYGSGASGGGSGYGAGMGSHHGAGGPHHGRS